MSISDKQQSFVNHYCTDAAENATEAYRMAGYSKVGANGNAARMIALDSIREAIAEKMAKIKAQCKDKVEQLLQDWHSLSQRAKIANDRTTEARCMENISKHHGFYAEDNKQRTEKVELDKAVTEEAQRIARIINLEQARKGTSQTAG